MRVLVVEDEHRLAENIVAALREVGLAVDHAADGEAGSYLAEQGMYDAIVLDLMLPGKSGQRILRDLRRTKHHTPVLILTAQEGKESVVELLNAGADDYLSKPFDLGELLARVKALIRRAKGVSTSVLKVSDVELNTVQQTVHRRSQPIDLSPTEYRILEYLIHRPRAIVSKQELLEHLYDFDWEHHSNVIEAHISNLRRKLNIPETEPLIETLRHRGYRLREESLAR
ncbi:response regulator transcription factor [Granulicella sibirica]|uniref:Phosphate regulon transcriptional regulatory protein PhoB (SphR) n=1 Tax=Granulicella sibirica TaxID=2479048 RepID=A0A4Q0T0U0_9BACT|nr:response regulator transcription factor [Granulicella sibirica]RXH57223.1 Phosphate regulon transcriptional regulatory protein PhoB (SphR) [Granulicella sibirica]